MHEIGFTKLFSTIITSTIWQEDKATKILWITMLALANRYGEVGAAEPGLARAAGLSLDETLAGLKKLSEPDPYSRNKEFEGRRIAKIEGGWQILNYIKYREKMRLRDAAYYRDYRATKRNHLQPFATNVTAPQPIAEAEAKKESIKKERAAPFHLPSLEDVKKYAESINFSLDCQKFIDHYKAVGWKVGRTKMVDWQAAVRTWRKDNAPPVPPKPKVYCDCGCGREITTRFQVTGSGKFYEESCRKKVLGW